MLCTYPMHDLYQGGLVCPACQCRLNNLERNIKAVKPTIYVLLFTGAIALLSKIGRWLNAK